MFEVYNRRPRLQGYKGDQHRNILIGIVVPDDSNAFNRDTTIAKSETMTGIGHSYEVTVDLSEFPPLTDEYDFVVDQLRGVLTDWLNSQSRILYGMNFSLAVNGFASSSGTIEFRYKEGNPDNCNIQDFRRPASDMEYLGRRIYDTAREILLEAHERYRGKMRASGQEPQQLAPSLEDANLSFHLVAEVSRPTGCAAVESD